MFEIQFDPDPACALFGLTWKKSRALLRNEAYAARAFTTLLSRRLIPLKWKQHDPLTFFSPGQRCSVLHKAISKSHLKPFVKIWRTFVDFYDSLLEPLEEAGSIHKCPITVASIPTLSSSLLFLFLLPFVWMINLLLFDYLSIFFPPSPKCTQ